MSDAAIATIVSGAITISTMVIGFLYTWVKLRYGVKTASDAAERAASKAEEAVKKASVVEDKIDENTAISTEAKNAAQKTEKQTNGTMERYDNQMAGHDSRISILEKQMAALEVSVEGVTKNIDSTRHEMRNHLQSITNKLDIMAGSKAPVVIQPEK